MSALSHLLSAAVALTLLCAGCPRRAHDGTASRAAEATLPELAREVGLTFPGSACLIGVSREKGIDDLVRFKVEMDREDLAKFLATSPVPQDAFEPGEGGLLGPDQGFWDPSRAVHLRTGQAIVKTHRALNVGIADGGPQKAIVYLVEHGT